MLRKMLKLAAVILSIASLLVILWMSALCLLGKRSLQEFKGWTNASTVVWFVTSSLWLMPGQRSKKA